VQPDAERSVLRHLVGIERELDAVDGGARRDVSRDVEGEHGPTHGRPGAGAWVRVGVLDLAGEHGRAHAIADLRERRGDGLVQGVVLDGLERDRVREDRRHGHEERDQADRGDGTTGD
jgi:hypothetical protein